MKLIHPLLDQSDRFGGVAKSTGNVLPDHESNLFQEKHKITAINEESKIILMIPGTEWMVVIWFGKDLWNRREKVCLETTFIIFLQTITLANDASYDACYTNIARHNRKFHSLTKLYNIVKS